VSVDARTRWSWETRASFGLGVVLVLALSGVVLAACGPAASSRGSQAHGADTGLVGYPSYLPKWTLHFRTDATLVGTAARPALTEQGDPVKVVTSHWSVLAVVSGPLVPGEGLPHQAPVTTCTWTVTLWHATGQVPIAVSAFDSIDQEGNVYRPQMVPGQLLPPSVLEPGRKVSFELRADEAVGEGLMRWAPIGKQIVAKWDFTVEND
jgi:hypothetical protein